MKYTIFLILAIIVQVINIKHKDINSGALKQI